MTGGQDETVTIRPFWIAWVEFQETVPEGIDNGSGTHWRSRMSGIRLFYSIDREKANRVDTTLIELRIVSIHHANLAFQ
jgi:hypothetical protein